ncbi:MAG: MurR/RpiR family transcriptional regulator [Clostridiales bacterium]|nr:MurR/RpiR family transcriptional regulator [Clostridiales bacterium]
MTKISRSLLKKIESVYPTLSKGHKKIAEFIAEHYDKAAFLTAAKLGETVGTSESTVVRFATELGFDGYPELQKALQEMIRNKLTAVQRMEVTSIRIGENDVVEKMLQSDIEMIKSTIELVSRKDFKNSVEAINKARKIYILGVRSSASLASFMAFNFNLAYDNVVLVDTNSDSEIFEQTFRINKEDVCIAISFPRYSNQIINALRFISDSGATVISITDSEYSPIAQFSTYLLLAKSDIASFVDSLVAPLSLINALIVAATLGKKTEVSNNFIELERIWDEYQVYDKVEESVNQ